MVTKTNLDAILQHGSMWSCVREIAGTGLSKSIQAVDDYPSATFVP